MHFSDWEDGKEFGIYKYQDDLSGEIHYIGKSDDEIKNRILKHEKDPKFFPFLLDSIYIIPLANPAESKGLETLLIDKYKPILNVKDKYNTYTHIGIDEGHWYSYKEYLKYKDDYKIKKVLNSMLETYWLQDKSITNIFLICIFIIEELIDDIECGYYRNYYGIRYIDTDSLIEMSRDLIPYIESILRVDNVIGTHTKIDELNAGRIKITGDIHYDKSSFTNRINKYQKIISLTKDVVNI